MAEFIESDPLDPRAVAAVRAYAAELAQTLGFPPGSVTVDGQDQYRRPGGAFLLVEQDGEVVGCGAVRSIMTQAGPAAEIKRMWLDPGVRGSGLGRRLLMRLHAVASGMGHARSIPGIDGTATRWPLPSTTNIG